MAKQIQKGKAGQDSTETKCPKAARDLSARREELKEEMDELIDEIDSVLEEDCEEFVKNYVQRGGQ